MQDRHLSVHRDWKYVPSGCILFHLTVSWFLLLFRECVVVVSPLSGSVLTVHLSFFFLVSHRWVLSCVSNLWLSEIPALHFLLLPWLGTRESGSGLIRYLQMGRRQGRQIESCNSFCAVFLLQCYQLHLLLFTHTTSCSSSLVSGEGLMRM